MLRTLGDGCPYSFCRDRPAGRSDLLGVLAENHIDVEYMYSLFTNKDGHAYMVLRINDDPRFLSALGDRQIRVMSKEDLGLI